MVNAVSSAGYQAYSYQQATTPVQEPQRGGDNRIEKRDAPAADSQRADQRDTQSRDDRNTRVEARQTEQPPERSDRGQEVDVTV